MARVSAASSLLLVTCSLFLGCAPQPGTTREPDLTGGATNDEQSKILEALKKAGIANKPANIFVDGDRWIVTLEPDGTGPDGKPPEGRPIPEKVVIDKATLGVTRPNKGVGNRGREGSP